MIAGESEQALHDDVFQSFAPKHATPGKVTGIPKKTWKPWHMPRKQWIRSLQWNAQIGQLIKELDLVDRPLRYLSLPGEDLLDIRVIRELCEKKRIKLRFLGFDNGSYSPGSETEINISKSEVFYSPTIFPGSDIKKDDFAMISDVNSVAYKEAKDHGPYDIINLDLCDCFSRAEEPSYYAALLTLINIQVRERTQPWLFFLTTRADRTEVNQDDLPHHWSCLRNNVQLSDAFKARLNSLLDDRFDQINGNIQVLRSLGQVPFGRLFALCIGKWLVRLMLSGSPLWVTEMLDGYWYRVSSAKTPNMLSLAFRFHQVTEPRSDDSGLTGPQQVPAEEVDEPALAIALFEKAEALVDIDTLLMDSPSMRKQMVQESIELLGSARYPITEYPVWADKKEKQLHKRLVRLNPERKHGKS